MQENTLEIILKGEAAWLMLWHNVFEKASNLIETNPQPKEERNRNLTSSTNSKSPCHNIKWAQSALSLACNAG